MKEIIQLNQKEISVVHGGCRACLRSTFKYQVTIWLVCGIALGIAAKTIVNSPLIQNLNNRLL